MTNLSPNSRVAEPDFEAARQWWAELPSIWTPLGWKDHLHRFSVLWSGAILAKPDLNRRTTRWAGLGAQFTFAPSINPIWNPTSTAFTRVDDGMTRQGWNDCPAPVLWTEFAADGLLLRQEVFGHIAGGLDVRRGDEPLFAWVRLSVQWLCKSLPVEKTHGFMIKINAPHFCSRMNLRDHHFMAAQSLYPRRLGAESPRYSARRGWRLLEARGKVRLGVAAGQECTLTYIPPHPRKIDATMFDAFVYLAVPARVGAHVDLLIPMLPAPRALFDAELALGYAGALAQANRYWRKTPASAARIATPEGPVNQAIAANVKMSQVLTERNPAGGEYSVVCGSLAYTDLWSTPGSMALAAMDSVGLHDEVAKYLRIFRARQGTVAPPGGSFGPHEGYLSSPKTLTSIDWLSDHGALLWAISRHALLTDDRSFIDDWREPVVKACDFIKCARRIRKHGGYEGIMPPAVATDNMTRIQAIWNDGWMYKGLTTAVRLLERVGNPRAAEFAAEAMEYRQAFGRAFEAACRRMPRWVDSAGRRRPILPTSLYGDKPAETRGAFYLDTGPLFLVFSGLMDAREPVMKSTLEWFRSGPQTRMLRRDANCWQVPCLDREISTCEPVYSWNVYHSWQSGDRVNFLTGLYSLLAGGMSRKTWVSCETRGGQSGTWFTFSAAIDLIRLAVIDDQIRPGALHLLRLAPLAWLRPGEEASFTNMPTEFGPADLKWTLTRDGKKLDVTFVPRFHHQPGKVVLHTPPMAGLREVRLNDKK